jgi:4-diphosphocytidyl-2-C-methyl-D-erythritol kinase
VTAPLRETAPAKINLTLRVTGRRDDGYHALESLVAFANLNDRLSLDPAEDVSVSVTGPFAAASGAAADNLVLKAFAALAGQVSGLRGGRFTLDKNIPVAAGLGGGSADAAAALRLLAIRNGIALDDVRLRTVAREVGADVPVCLDPRARIMRGAGEDLSVPMVLPRLDAVLVNPRAAVATKDVFAKFDKRDAGPPPRGEVPLEYEPLLSWLGASGNDLTTAASMRAPVIRDVLAALSALPGCRLARMSGSGATCFAIFDAADETQAAANKLRVAYPDWWICPVVLG